MPSRRTPANRPALLRRRPLAACLAAALLLQAGGAMAASAPRGSLVVQNCDDSGAGSLRDVVAGAPSGAVVDLGGLGCTSIALSSGAITTTVADLTLQGPGADALAIVGSPNDRLIDAQGSGTLTMAGLTLRDGHGATDGGCVLVAGNLALTSVTVSACAAGTPAAPNMSGGGIRVLGNATLVDSTFDGNSVDGNLRVRGGALAVGGTLSDSGGTFTNNVAHSHSVDGGSAFDNIVEGGAVFALGDTDLTTSTISGNSAYSDSYEIFGGGIAVGSHVDDVDASIDVLDSTISGNTVASACEVCAPQGGGIAAVGFVRLRHTLLADNTVGSTNHYGGGGGLRAIDSASIEIDNSTISGNHADSAGGGVLAELGVLAIDSTQVTDNFAGNQGGTDEGGGGLLCLGCAVQVISSSITGNVAEAAGGGIGILFGEYASTASVVFNSTISGNSAYEGGGFMLDGGNAQIMGSTIAFNTASSRGAGFSASEYSYAIELQSTIVSNNLTGDAANNVWAFPDTVSGANNLIPNADGLPASMPFDTLVADPLLLPLADNGGGTPTHALGAGSPATDAGNDAAGLVFDQRGDGYLRDVGAAADIGAYEQQDAAPSDVVFADGFEGA